MGVGALRREPERKAENHFIARVWGRGESREGTHSRPRPGGRLRGAWLLGPGEARVVAAAAASAVAAAGAWLCWPCRREHRAVGTGILEGVQDSEEGGVEQGQTWLGPGCHCRWL